MTAEQKARNLIASKSNIQLVQIFEMTEEMPITKELAMVRGWLMDEFERRDPKAFGLWIESDDSPRWYY